MRKEKQLLLDDIQNRIQSAPGVLITRYQKLNAGLASNLRKTVRASGGDVEVVPKRVFFKAAQQAGVAIESDILEGHIALVFAGEDPVGVTKAVFDFGKANTDVVEVVAGKIEGQLYSAADVKKLSELPSMPEMRAQLLGLLEAPMSQTLAVMEAILTSVLHCIENKCNKES